MTTVSPLPSQERRKHPRFYVSSRITMAVEDANLNESIGLGEPGDISLGGVRVRNLPACPSVHVGDRLALLLLDREDALSLKGEVVHHGTPDTFGVEFRELSLADQISIRDLITRLYHFPGSTT